MLTVGCDMAEKILTKYHSIFKNNFDYEETILIYFEAGSSCRSQAASLRCATRDRPDKEGGAAGAGVREFAGGKGHYPLERCVVYDVGARAYEFSVHLDDVIGTGKNCRSRDAPSGIFTRRGAAVRKDSGYRSRAEKNMQRQDNFLRG